MAKTTAIDPKVRAYATTGFMPRELAALLEVPDALISRIIVEHEVVPVGSRGGNAPTYRMADVAKYVSKPELTDGQIIEYLMAMKVEDMPQGLRKEFWSAMREKQAFERDEGHLWSSTEVIEKVSSLVKMVAMSARLFSDGVERNTELSDRQKTVIQSLVDGLLMDIQQKMESEFGETPEVSDGKEAASEDDL